MAAAFTRRHRSDPDWRAVFADDLAGWKARSYAELRAALSDEAAYEREGPGGIFGLICRPLSESFIRYSDGRLG